MINVNIKRTVENIKANTTVYSPIRRCGCSIRIYEAVTLSTLRKAATAVGRELRLNWLREETTRWLIDGARAAADSPSGDKESDLISVGLG